MPTTKASKPTPIDPQFMTRFHAALRLGRHPNTITRMEEQEGLPPIRVNGHILYRVADVEALASRWRLQAAQQAERKSIVARNRETKAPAGWRLLANAAQGPFIGECVAVSWLIKTEDRDSLAGVERSRRCIVSMDLLADAFAEADRLGLNVISNMRGIVAVRVK